MSDLSSFSRCLCKNASLSESIKKAAHLNGHIEFENNQEKSDSLKLRPLESSQKEFSIGFNLAFLAFFV